MKFVHDVDQATLDGTDTYIVEEKTYKANDTIAAGQAVAMDVTGGDVNDVVVADGDVAGARGCVGIAMEAATAGDNVRVLKKGIWPDALCLTGVAAGAPLFVTATPGALDDAQAAADYVMVGIALEAAQGTDPYSCNVWVNAPF